MSMNREQMMRYLDDPTQLNEKSLGELKEILDEFPFFQTAHMLYARNLLNEKSFRFTNQLKVAAASVTDRSMLYFLLNPKARREAQLQERKVTGAPESVIETIDAPDIAKEESAETGFFELADESAHIQSPKEHSSDIAAEVKAGEEEDNVQSEKTEKTFDLLDFDVMEPSFYQLDSKVDSIENLSELSKSINRSAQKNNINKEQKEPEDKSKESLIDKFLESKPTLSPARRAETNQEDISERSHIETDEFMTETLAHIYVKQGYYEKAIKAFQKLSLKYPEKSVYFARQIEDVRKLLNR